MNTLVRSHNLFSQQFNSKSSLFSKCKQSNFKKNILNSTKKSVLISKRSIIQGVNLEKAFAKREKLSFYKSEVYALNFKNALKRNNVHVFTSESPLNQESFEKAIKYMSKKWEKATFSMIDLRYGGTYKRNIGEDIPYEILNREHVDDWKSFVDSQLSQISLASCAKITVFADSNGFDLIITTNSLSSDPPGAVGFAKEFLEAYNNADELDLDSVEPQERVSDYLDAVPSSYQGWFKSLRFSFNNLSRLLNFFRSNETINSARIKRQTNDPKNDLIVLSHEETQNIQNLAKSYNARLSTLFAGSMAKAFSHVNESSTKVNMSYFITTDLRKTCDPEIPNDRLQYFISSVPYVIRVGNVNESPLLKDLIAYAEEKLQEDLDNDIPFKYHTYYIDTNFVQAEFEIFDLGDIGLDHISKPLKITNTCLAETNTYNHFGVFLYTFNGKLHISLNNSSKRYPNELIRKMMNVSLSIMQDKLDSEALEDFKSSYKSNEEIQEEL